MLKKFFLDDRKEEENCSKLSNDELRQLREALNKSIDITSEPSNLLRRKAEIICKIHKKEESYGELISHLQSLASLPISSDEVVLKSKEFAMYSFELLAEYHLP